MIKNDCWIKSEIARNELKELFSSIDRDLSSYYQDNPPMREEHLEGRFTTLFENHSKRFLERINQDREAKGLFRITLSMKHITYKEKIHGADIGLIVNINIPEEMEIRKAVLVQSKRLIPKNEKFDQNCTYKELLKKNGLVEPQWERMLDITSSSVYFFYNPDRLQINRRNRNLGTRVISAQNIKGQVAAGVTSLSAREVYQQGKPFSEWIVDNFICCIVGDTSKNTIETAQGLKSDFQIKHVFEYWIEKEKISEKDIK